jgi:endoglucanase
VNLIVNGTFDGGTISPWLPIVNTCDDGAGGRVTCDAEITGSVDVLGTDTAMKLVIDDFEPVPSVYDVQVGQPLAIRGGRMYTLSFWAMSDLVPRDAVVKIGQRLAPYATHFQADLEIPYMVSPTQYGASFQFTFTAPVEDPDAWISFFLGGATPATIKIDSILLVEGGGSGGGGGGETIRLNQTGYVPAGVKRATVISSSPSPLAWMLVDGSGAAVAAGMTAVKGTDAASGDPTHVADFSSFTGTGDGFRLTVGTERSWPFAIRRDLYGALRRDALRFYYHQRSSTAIVQPFAEGATWARQAGHPDTAVPCLPGSGCSYSLDVSRGWYDAGDHGKYVVAGGISVWTLGNLYERTRRIGTTLAELGDGSLNIPESGNGTADLLDEIRWQMTFMLGMQVPASQPLAGMAHHKIHDDQWTPLPTAPADDLLPRYLHAPSTAATLNLAATAAQCARLFRGVDDTFAARCLAAAERAFAAALANPARYAPANDTAGGGPYDDPDVTDELYWAAAELYITTGTGTYLDALRASPHFAGLASIYWASVSGLGTLSLALLQSGLAVAEVAAVRRAVLAAADAELARIDGGGYGSPLAMYYWGSNSAALNVGMVLALAWDISGSARYLAGATATMDYVLGRNALDQSYVTGYGDRPFRNPHHRFWAHAYDPSTPTPPPGVLAEGANQFLEGVPAGDPIRGCAPMKCFRDDAHVPSFTEPALNVNAPLAWMAAWLHEMGTNPPSQHLGIPDAGGTGGAGGASGSGGATPGTGGAGGTRGGSGGSGAGSGTGGAGASGGSGGGVTPGTGGAGGAPGGSGGSGANPGTGGAVSGAGGLGGGAGASSGSGGGAAGTGGGPTPGTGGTPPGGADGGPAPGTGGAGGDRPPPGDGCGCAVTDPGGPASLPGALALAALLASRRRRPKRGPS